MDIKVTQRRNVSQRSRRSLACLLSPWPMSRHTSKVHNRRNQNWSRLCRRNLMPGTSLDITQRPSPELPGRGLRPSARYVRSRTSEHRAPPTHPLKPTQNTPYTRYVSKIMSTIWISNQVTSQPDPLFNIFTFSFLISLPKNHQNNPK